jgi:hypothetical protein
LIYECQSNGHTRFALMLGDRYSSPSFATFGRSKVKWRNF